MSTKIVNIKDIRNYIHNDIGISKAQIGELILEEIKKIIQEEITKILNDEDRIQNMIEKEIIRQIKIGGSDYKRRSFLISTMDEIYNKIDGIIHEEVLKRIQITLKDDLN